MSQHSKKKRDAKKRKQAKVKQRQATWPSENESVMSGKLAILPFEAESKTSVCGTLLITL